MKAYLMGQHSLTRCVIVWGALYPLSIYLVDSLVMLYTLHTQDRIFLDFLRENREWAFYLNEALLVTFGYIYIPLGVVIVSQSWQNCSHKKLGYYISRLYYLIACVLVIIVMIALQNAREHPIQFYLKEPPISYSTKWYLIIVIAISILSSIVTEKKRGTPSIIEEIRLDEEEDTKSQKKEKH